MDLNQLKKELPTSKRSAGGSVCEFFTILDGKVGVKCYDSRRIRDEAYINQRFAARKAMAPRAYGRARWNNDYIYFTEVAQKCTYQRFVSDAFKLYREMKGELGLQFSDLWIENVGILRGKLVCIDWEYQSFNQVYGEPYVISFIKDQIEEAKERIKQGYVY